jgi:hypothetical protein
MPVMLERWNDDKMDALDAKVDAVDAKVDDLAGQMEKGFVRVDVVLREQRQEMKAGFERVDDRFERMQRLMIQFCGLMIAALIGLIATQL